MAQRNKRFEHIVGKQSWPFYFFVLLRHHNELCDGVWGGAEILAGKDGINLASLK
jgi:hypothetical protein